jgi:hypothetical protein
VVFGNVVEGMGVVKRMEAMGSKSGVTSRRVVIAGCGELESGLQRALKLQAERDALAASKKDPLGIDPDAAAISRLRALRGEGAETAAAALPHSDGQHPAPDAVVDAVSAQLEEPPEQPRTSAAAMYEDTAVEGGAEVLSEVPEAGAGEGGSEDVYAGLSGRQKRLLELRAKIGKAQKANEHASVAEFKRLKKGAPDKHMERKKWLDADGKERKVWNISQ